MITETTRIVEMACIPWRIEEGRLYPVKGSWTLCPVELNRTDIQALLSCPRCEAVMPFQALPTDDIDRSKQVGVLTRVDVTCTCGFLFTAKLQDWDKRRLYCIVYTVPGRTPGTSHMKKEYLHAVSREEAILFFSQGQGLTIQYRLIDAAPVFGYFARADDKDQSVLMTD